MSKQCSEQEIREGNPTNYNPPKSAGISRDDIGLLNKMQGKISRYKHIEK